jgi:IS605 OrfB family transposase
VIYLSEITIQTLIPTTNENKIGIDYITEFGVIFGRCIRTAFNIRNNKGKVETPSQQLKTDIAKELESRYGVSNTEARCAAVLGLANYDSQASLVDTYITSKYEAIKGIKRSIIKLESKLKKATKINDTWTVKNLKKTINYKHQKIQHLSAEITQLKIDRANGKYHVSFGTKKLFGAQFRLDKNGYNNHQEWLKEWQQSRSHIVYYEGAAIFQTGNQLVRYNHETQTLTVTVSPVLQHKYGKKIVLSDVKFARGSEWLSSAISPVIKTSKRKDKKGKIKFESRTASAQPVTYRFVIKQGKIYLNATIDAPTKTNSTSLKNGALGVDFNPNSIDWSVIDKQGNLKRHGSIKINVQDKRTNQTSDIIGKACAELVRLAELYQIPIVIEDLDFEKKKASMKEKGAKYARMLSNMAYSKFNQMFESRCNKFGIELLKVDAAYTSVIGVTKYMAMYSLSSGCAAALVIARRGQNRTENLPKSHATFFKKPEDLSKPGAWKKVARKINIVGALNRHRWYSNGKKQVSSNSRMLRKLRQNSPSGGTVQLIESPHIPKTSALKVSLELVLSLVA